MNPSILQPNFGIWVKSKVAYLREERGEALRDSE
jgi:hypothetical protein